VQAFAALSDPTRRQIVELLSKRELTAGDIAARFPMSGPAISKHLRVLRDAGLCTYERRAQQRVYRLRPEPMAEAEAWMHKHIDAWRRTFDALGQHLDTMRKEETKDARHARR
jgi:DNA-binding transcriptional ArsR family regulator